MECDLGAKYILLPQAAVFAWRRIPGYVLFDGQSVTTLLGVVWITCTKVGKETGRDLVPLLQVSSSFISRV